MAISTYVGQKMDQNDQEGGQIQVFQTQACDASLEMIWPANKDKKMNMG